MVIPGFYHLILARADGMPATWLAVALKDEATALVRKIGGQHLQAVNAKPCGTCLPWVPHMTVKGGPKKSVLSHPSLEGCLKLGWGVVAIGVRQRGRTGPRLSDNLTPKEVIRVKQWWLSHEFIIQRALYYGEVSRFCSMGVVEKLWRVADIADREGVSPSTIRAYHSRGEMPPADGYDKHGPFWRLATLKKWDRPGRGRTRKATQ